MRTNLLRIALIAGGTLMLSALSVYAQDYGYTGYVAPDESVTVTVPHYGPQRNELGAPYKRVSLSKEVYVGDLNLNSRRGVRIMHQRIRLTARLLCRDLDERYPVTADDSPACYTNAVNEAMYRADRAIDEDRSYND